MKYEEISLNPLISDVVSSVLEQNPDHKVSVIIYDLPPCYGDKTMIQQVFMNLISNAVKFSRKEATPGRDWDSQDHAGTVYYVKTMA